VVSHSNPHVNYIVNYIRVKVGMWELWETKKYQKLFCLSPATIMRSNKEVLVRDTENFSTANIGHVDPSVSLRISVDRLERLERICVDAVIPLLALLRCTHLWHLHSISCMRPMRNTSLEVERSFQSSSHLSILCFHRKESSMQRGSSTLAYSERPGASTTVRAT